MSKVTSAERGELVTVCSAINAIGNHLPPFNILPRKNWQDKMLDNTSPGTAGADSRYMNQRYLMMPLERRECRHFAAMWQKCYEDLGGNVRKIVMKKAGAELASKSAVEVLQVLCFPAKPGTCREPNPLYTYLPISKVVNIR